MDSSQNACRLFFVDAAMQAYYGKQPFGAVDLSILTDLRHMLESHSLYVRAFMTINEQLESGLFPQSVHLELIANQQPSREQTHGFSITASAVQQVTDYLHTFD